MKDPTIQFLIRLQEALDELKEEVKEGKLKYDVAGVARVRKKIEEAMR